MNIENLTYDEARELLRVHPTFAYAALCMYRTSTDESERERLRVRLSAMIGSQDDLRELLGVDSQSLVDFYQEGVPVRLSTEDTISTFIDKFTPAGAPVSDYLASIENLEPQVISSGSVPAPESRESVIADEVTGDIAEESDVAGTEPTEASPLTESFARILIKNGNYKKALEIISGLNLKNSEKSVYFADQIRFLKKVIALESVRR
ncbi:MAG: hypothetical protein K2H86_01520 [Muribaculaceae bacterium]|nr:hypothetical protein [Muribaculaceae bacterium]